MPNCTGLMEIVRRARDGDEDSWAALIEQISPLLELQASYRLRGALRRLYDPQDLVEEVWIVALARLDGLELDERSGSENLMRFLSSTMTNKVNDLLRKHLQRNGLTKDLALRANSNSKSSLSQLPGSFTSALTRAARSESRLLLARRMKSLRPDEQEVLILRGIEQIPNEEVARKLGEQPSTVSMRYARAIAKLRSALPVSVYLDMIPS